MAAFKEDREFFSWPVDCNEWKSAQVVHKQARANSVCARLLVFFDTIKDKKALRQACQPKMKEVAQEGLDIPRALQERGLKAVTMSL